nr:G-type lectin S-receptor-like serine/threonine-protein kinase At4g27290 [Ipomoea batatas]
MKSMEELKLYFFCSTLLSLLTFCTSIDTITTDHPITDGATIVSAGGIFELGFFSPGNSKNRYVGIWYSKIPTKDAVWVANRQTPLNNTSGKLMIKDNGILVLLDGSNEEIWSSNSSKSLKNPVDRLSDTGNLVVAEINEHNSENSAWQSFDYPGNTLLPGMKIGKNLATGHAWSLTSWKSTDDPALGEYTDMLDVNGFPQFIVFKGANKSVITRYGPWNGHIITGSPYNKNNTIFTIEMFMDETEIYYKYELKDHSVPTRSVLTPFGANQRLIWIERSQSWSVFLTGQTDHCGHYALCGAFGKCNINNSPPCDCLKGFIPKYPKEWDAADWSNGCTRRTQLDCGDGDRFLKYTGIKLPDTRQSWFNGSISLEECKRLCLKSCNCSAYSNLDVRNGGSGCLLWFGDLKDIKASNEIDQYLYVRVAASDYDIHQSSQKKHEVMEIVIPTISGILILSFLVWLALHRKKRGAKIDKDLDLPLFSLESIISATNNFSSANLIGEGGFGPVYKGMLLSGTEVAVKKLSENSGQGAQEWENEVITIAKLQHRNLVTLLVTGRGVVDIALAKSSTHGIVVTDICLCCGVKKPAFGSSGLFHEFRLQAWPVAKFRPTFMPVSKSLATGFFKDVDEFDDQISSLLPSRSTRIPLSLSISLPEVLFSGVSRLATQTTSLVGILLYQMPTYRFLDFPGLKNPSSKLPPAETMVVPSVMG